LLFLFFGQDVTHIAEGIGPRVGINVLDRGLSLAGFQVIINGRFWVITEADGVVHIEWTFSNPSAVTASDGFVNFSICDACNFVKEPEGFRRLPGLYETERNMQFSNIIARTTHTNIAIDVKVPEGIRQMDISMTYRCRTCITDPKTLRGIVNLQRPFSRLPILPKRR
jgi:hypothetical protein